MRSTIVSMLLVVAGSTTTLAQNLSLDRAATPVVLTGSELPSMINMSVDTIIGFRYQGVWQQVPVQIDERKFVEYREVYNTTDPAYPTGLGTMAYADTTTYTGADDNPLFDTDDELVLMVRSVGDRAPAELALPLGTVADTGVEIEITDPLDGGVGYLYLFASDGSLFPDAGQDYISYTFDLLAGSYIPNYNMSSGFNPENSDITSAYYHTYFSDRWICDELNVLTDGSSGVDILDRHKTLFAPGACVRTEDTFCYGDGAFFTNKDGALRAIRSYMGANSGPLTQREHLFYERQHIVTTYLRVHEICCVTDLYDHSPNATGMWYFNDLNLSGLYIDGQPDSATTGAITWEMVTGAQGSVIQVRQMMTDIPAFTYTSYYSDDNTPEVTQCTGDAYEYATSGIFVDHSLPNTDPREAEYNSLAIINHIYYEQPDESVDTAQWRLSQTQMPLEVSIQAYPGYAPGDFNHDNHVDISDLDLFLPCMTGAEIALTIGGCEDKDLDGDNDVDLVDYGIVQRCLSGPMVPADHNCAD